jgi:hypothetical protein
VYAASDSPIHNYKKCRTPYVSEKAVRAKQVNKDAALAAAEAAAAVGLYSC